MTKVSFTDKQTILSTPFSRKTGANSLYPGKWEVEQVGVNAPGKAKRTTVFPFHPLIILTHGKGDIGNSLPFSVW